MITGSTSLSTDAAARVASAFPATLNSRTPPVTAVMQFGGLTASTRAREAFIDDNIYRAAESVTGPSQSTARIWSSATTGLNPTALPLKPASSFC